MTGQYNLQKLNQKPKTNKPKTDSFLESFRDIGNGAVSSFKNDLVKEGSKDVFNSLSPFQVQKTAEPKNDYPGEDLWKNDLFWENKLRNQKRQAEIVRREEKVIFTRQERETQTQVRNLQEEIKKLAVATGDLAREAQIAAMQEEVNPGTYHLNFLQKLFLLVKALRSQVQESSAWLSSFNSKSKKKNNYWSKFKKSGSSFSLHHDRSVATQAG